MSNKGVQSVGNKICVYEVTAFWNPGNGQKAVKILEPNPSSIKTI